MAESFVIGDTHFGHKGVCEYTGRDGGKLRPWSTPAEMDEEMVRRWNAIVPASGAKVYVLGDVVINRRALPILARLNGKKKLIMGNHDIFPLKDYLPYFYDVAAYRVMDDLIMSHIPIHEESLKQRWKANVHGHLHDGRVMTQKSTGRMRRDPYTNRYLRMSWPESVMEEVIHPRYLCVSAEHTDFAPISMDEVRVRIGNQQGE